MRMRPIFFLLSYSLSIIKSGENVFFGGWMDGWMVKGNTFILLRVVSKAKNHFTDERHKKTGSKKRKGGFYFFLEWMDDDGKRENM